MRIVLLGPPGAGKGTQAVILQDKLHFLHLSTGDILRENVKMNTEIGKKAKSFMEKGELVPDDIVIEMMLDKIRSSNLDKGFMLDGFPRTIYQAKKIDEALGYLKLSIGLVIYLKTSIETVIKRLTGRRLCKECGANYHITNMPPKKQGICDKCNGSLYQRKDDNEETIKTRLDVYNNQTKELIDYYKEKGILREISGDLDAGEVYKELFQIIND
ncbi:MAG: adenylate kinase [Candidatus Omnitrophota bacterium]